LELKERKYVLHLSHPANFSMTIKLPEESHKSRGHAASMHRLHADLPLSLLYLKASIISHSNKRKRQELQERVESSEANQEMK
jgi:hypothetical protein